MPAITLGVAIVRPMSCGVMGDGVGLSGELAGFWPAPRLPDGPAPEGPAALEDAPMFVTRGWPTAGGLLVLYSVTDAATGR